MAASAGGSVDGAAAVCVSLGGPRLGRHAAVGCTLYTVTSKLLYLVPLARGRGWKTRFRFVGLYFLLSHTLDGAVQVATERR